MAKKNTTKSTKTTSTSARVKMPKGAKSLPVFLGRRELRTEDDPDPRAAGLLHSDGTLTVGGYTYSSPSRAQHMLTGSRSSGWDHWLFIDASLNIWPICTLRVKGDSVQIEDLSAAEKKELSEGQCPDAARRSTLEKLARSSAKGNYHFELTYLEEGQSE